jgi:hypothetical protein
MNNKLRSIVLMIPRKCTIGNRRTAKYLQKCKMVSNVKYMTRSIFLLRLFHFFTAIYFIACLLELYYAGFTKNFNLIFLIAFFSLGFEGVVVFIINKGDCPLIHIQRKINDPIPFFNLFLPAKLAKLAIPFFSVITIFAVIIISLRFFF